MGQNDETLTTHTPASEPGSTAPSRSSRPRFGRYVVGGLLGRGGVGAVYEAEDPELGRRVAIKVLREDRSDAEGLKREAQALARLVHPNVVTVHDVGEADGEVFIVMQLIVGETIDSFIAARRPKPRQILALFRHAGVGLAAAHAAGLVHCDFKPGNVLVDREGVVRVSDFGLARATRALSSASSQTLGATVEMTTVSGTPAYMAPEQADGVVTAASDQFAFCVALWEALVGERPFLDPLDLQSVLRVRRPLPRDARLPARIRRALDRGLSISPDDRFASMHALLAALEVPRWQRPAVVAGLGLATAAVATTAIVLAGRDRGSAAWDGADLANTRPLTHYGNTACAYSPAVDLDGGIVVFDRTVGDTVDLYQVPLAGGVPRQLTSAPTWEWRAQPGRRAGEIVHLIHDPKQEGKAHVVYRDLATGSQTVALRVLAWDALVIGDALYFSPDEPSGLRRKVGAREEEFAQPTNGRTFLLLAKSPAGDRIVTTSGHADDGPTYPCVIEVATRKVTCLPTTSSTARPAFGADGQAFYYNARDGIRRHVVATGEETLVIPDVWGAGGLAIPPDGSALVYSRCDTTSTIVDATDRKTIVDDTFASQPVVASDGAIAWVREDRSIRVLMLRTADGREVQLTNLELGSVRLPTFSPDGKQLAFAVGAPSSGIHTVRLAVPGSTRPLTKDPHDTRPIWTASGTIGFTRREDNGGNHAFAVDSDGRARQLGNATRTVLAGRQLANLVLATNEDTGQLFWIDVVTGRESPGPPRPAGYLSSAAISADGTWIAYQMGPNGLDLWRLRLEPLGTLEHVVSYGLGHSVGHIAIRDDGHVLAAPATWSGDLVVVPARPGNAF